MISKPILVNNLYNVISKYDNFVLYGAGYIANILLESMDENHKPQCCIVTSNENGAKTIHGVPVFEYTEKKEEIKNNKTLVIIAVSELYMENIATILGNDKIDNFIYALNFFCSPWNDRFFYTKYKQKDIGQLGERIHEWRGKNTESVEVGARIEQPEIVLVVENFAPRVVKILKALIGRGEKVGVLFNTRLVDPQKLVFTSDLPQEVKCKYYSSGEELLFYLLQNNNKVVHIFSNSYNPYITCILIKFRKYIGKVVYETYDIANGFYTNIEEEKLQIERYCFEHADGICYREFSLEYLENVMHLKIAKKRIRFWDYCEDELLPLTNKEDEKELSLCFSGGVVTEEEYPDCPFGGFLEIADWCTRNKCHLHIYPSIWDAKRYSKYIERDKMDIYFHFHKTVPYDKLIAEISQYDYGITPTMDTVWNNQASGYNTVQKYIYAATNKYFDYIDAGLPIITAIPQKFAQYLAERGVLINWTNGQYDYDYLIRRKDIMRKKALELREKLRVSNHIDELINFYEGL